MKQYIMRNKLIKITLLIGTFILLNGCSLSQYTTAREAKESAISIMKYRETLTFEELQKLDGKPSWVPIRSKYYYPRYYSYYHYYWIY